MREGHSTPRSGRAVQRRRGVPERRMGRLTRRAEVCFHHSESLNKIAASATGISIVIASVNNFVLFVLAPLPQTFSLRRGLPRPLDGDSLILEPHSNRHHVPLHQPLRQMREIRTSGIAASSYHISSEAHNVVRPL